LEEHALLRSLRAVKLLIVAPYPRPLPHIFKPEIISGKPRSYPENLEAIAAAVPEL